MYNGSHTGIAHWSVVPTFIIYYKIKTIHTDNK